MMPLLNIHLALLTLVLLLCFPHSGVGMMASPHAFTIDNANLTIALKIKGDEQSHWLTDMDGKHPMVKPKSLFC
jgi:hypothetical protein